MSYISRASSRWRFSIAARRFVPVVAVVIRAVRFPGFLLGMIDQDLIRGFDPCHLWPVLDRNLLGHEFFLALALPELPQFLRVEFIACAVAEVYDLVSDASGDQPVCLSARHALRHLLELFDLEKAPDTRADLATLDESRPFRH